MQLWKPAQKSNWVRKKLGLGPIGMNIIMDEEKTEEKPKEETPEEEEESELELDEE